jgi:hypothetical protein
MSEDVYRFACGSAAEALGYEKLRLEAALRDCIDDLEQWGYLALSSDYARPEDPQCLATDLARHRANLTGEQ